MKTVRKTAVLALAAASTVLIAQDAGLHFEVASVKPSGPPPANRNAAFMRLMGGPGSNDPEHLRYTRASMVLLLAQSFLIQPDQIIGPDWVKTDDAAERFDITANLPPGTTREQMAQMMLNLLRERFHFAWHSDKKDLDVYELVVGKEGSKLKQAEVPGTIPEFPEGAAHIDKGTDGFPVLPPGSTIGEGLAANGHGQMFMSLDAFKGFHIVTNGPRANGLTRFTLRNVTVGQLIGFAQLYTGWGHIVDRTGLTDAYDVKVAFGGQTSAGSPGEASEPAPDICNAFEKQLGLKFQKTKAPLDVIVVDRIDKVPTKN